VRWAALVLLALALSGCESTQEKAAKVKRVAAISERANDRRRALAQRALSITHLSANVKVLQTTLLRSPEGTAAAVVTLRNLAAKPISDAPIQITVRNAQGASLYTNATPGLGVGLAEVPLLPAHAVTEWIDDQIQASGAPAHVEAKVGEGSPASGTPPQLSFDAVHVFEEAAGSAGAEGELVNHSQTAQQELVIYAIARKDGRIVAAGRAIVAEAGPGTTTHFQAFMVGKPRGAQLQLAAPPSTPG